MMAPLFSKNIFQSRVTITVVIRVTANVKRISKIIFLILVLFLGDMKLIYLRLNQLFNKIINCSGNAFCC